MKPAQAVVVFGFCRTWAFSKGIKAQEVIDYVVAKVGLPGGEVFVCEDGSSRPIVLSREAALLPGRRYRLERVAHTTFHVSDKGGRADPVGFQRFAESAVKPQETDCKKFWKVGGDPSANFRSSFLIWKRPVYAEIEEQIGKDLGDGYRIFIILGTEGSGTSMFAVQFALKQCRASGRALLYKKSDEVFIVDGTHGSAEGPYDLCSPEVQELRNDSDAWLVIDGEQQGQLVCECKILQACSTKKSNFEEFGKLGTAQKLYMPVWSEDEVHCFLEDYEQFRGTYQKVPEKADVLAQYEKVGGIPRYLFQSRKLQDGRERVEAAVSRLAQDTKLLFRVLSADLIEDVSDCILHFVPASRLTLKRLDFASAYVWDELRIAYEQQSLVKSARFLQQTVSYGPMKTVWGKIYELVVCRMLSGGGAFRCKEVTKDGGVVRTGVVKLKKRQRVLCKDVEHIHKKKWRLASIQYQ